MMKLNSGKYKVTTIDPYKFSIDVDASEYEAYAGNATCAQVKVTQKVQFKSLRDSLEYPQFLDVDMFKSWNEWPPMVLHLGMQALAKFTQEHKGALPRPWNKSDADEVLNIVREFNEEQKQKSEVAAAKAAASPESEELRSTAAAAATKIIDDFESKSSVVSLLAYTSQGALPPLCAVMGGMVAQEVLKGIMHKFAPLQQWMYVGAEEVIPLAEDGSLLVGFEELQVTWK